MPGFNINGTGGTVDAKIDIYRTYRYRINNIVGGGVTFERSQYNTVLDVTLPTFDFEVLQIPGMSLDYKVPKKPIFNNVDITFYDIYGLQEKFEEWTDKIWNPVNGLFDGEPTDNLKGTVEIAVLDANGEKKGDHRIYVLQGAWPKRMSHSKLSMADESLKTLIVEFSLDFYTIK